jgi:hypothetical protein
MTIPEIAEALENAPRVATVEPPFARHVMLCEEVVQQMTRDLRLAAGERPETESFARARE